MRSGTKFGVFMFNVFWRPDTPKNKTFEQYHQCIPNKINLIKDLESQYSPHLLVGVCAKYTHTHTSLMCTCVCCMSECIGARGGELPLTSFPFSDATLHRPILPTNYPSDTLRKFPNGLPSRRRTWYCNRTESFFHFPPLFPCFVSLTF